VPCRAGLEVHKDEGKDRPLVTRADAGTRHGRKMAHKRFDPIWQSRLGKGKAKWKVRSAVYAWLAGHLEIPVGQCHIALFDLETCVKVIEICVKEDYGPV